MPEALTHVRVTNVPGLLILLVLWIVFFQCTHLLVMLLRREPLIGWAVGPLGVSIVFLHEPSTVFIWLEVVCPALVSGGTLYFGLFTRLSPVMLPSHPLVEILIIAVGVLLTSTKDIMGALRDLRHPLWGEARLLRKIQTLRASWARIHFTPFGYSYLYDHFRSSPTDLLQAL
jgi:uncharacterized membrane protein YdcZ (DUF606 family)